MLLVIRRPRLLMATELKKKKREEKRNQRKKIRYEQGKGWARKTSVNRMIAGVGHPDHVHLSNKSDLVSMDQAPWRSKVDDSDDMR